MTDAESSLVEAALAYKPRRAEQEGPFGLALIAVRRERFEALEPGWRERLRDLLRAHLRCEREYEKLADQVKNAMTEAEWRQVFDEAYEGASK